MYQHFILTYSNFNYGKRIALHKVYESVNGITEFMNLTKNIKEKFNNIDFGFHHIQTKKITWQSVKDYDMFFSDIEEINDELVFEDLLLDDTTINPIDVAKLILSKRECTPLEIQKLVYFCSCRYFEVYKKHLFKDDFEAWDYGPVIASLYEEFRDYGRNKIKMNIKSDTKVCIYSKMSKFDNYEEISKIVDETLEKYSNHTAGNLVKESHIENGPWDVVYRDGMGRGNIISKNIIEEYLKR